MVAVENGRFAFSKELVDADWASTAPAASPGLPSRQERRDGRVGDRKCEEVFTRRRPVAYTTIRCRCVNSVGCTYWPVCRLPTNNGRALIVMCPSASTF